MDNSALDSQTSMPYSPHDTSLSQRLLWSPLPFPFPSQSMPVVTAAQLLHHNDDLDRGKKGRLSITTNRPHKPLPPARRPRPFPQTKTRAKAKACRMDGCRRNAKSRQLCKSHGGGRRCEVPFCPTSARPGGYCITHGGGLCQVVGCHTGARSRGLCARHTKAQQVDSFKDSAAVVVTVAHQASPAIPVVVSDPSLPLSSTSMTPMSMTTKEDGPPRLGPPMRFKKQIVTGASVASSLMTFRVKKKKRLTSKSKERTIGVLSLPLEVQPSNNGMVTSSSPNTRTTLSSSSHTPIKSSFSSQTYSASLQSVIVFPRSLILQDDSSSTIMMTKSTTSSTSSAMLSSQASMNNPMIEQLAPRLPKEVVLSPLAPPVDDTTTTTTWVDGTVLDMQRAWHLHWSFPLPSLQSSTQPPNLPLLSSSLTIAMEDIPSCGDAAFSPNSFYLI